MAAKLRAEVAVALHGRELLSAYLNGATLRELADRMGIADHKTVAGLLKKTIAEFKQRFELEASELLTAHLSHLDSLITQAQSEWTAVSHAGKKSDPRWGALIINALDRKAALLGLGPESMRATELAADLDVVRQKRWAELRDSPMGRLLTDGTAADAFYSDPYRDAQDDTVIDVVPREVDSVGDADAADGELVTTPEGEAAARSGTSVPQGADPAGKSDAGKRFGNQVRFPVPAPRQSSEPDTSWFSAGEDGPRGAPKQGGLERGSGARPFSFGKRSIGGRK
jgi:hypothetical protein